MRRLKGPTVVGLALVCMLAVLLQAVQASARDKRHTHDMLGHAGVRHRHRKPAITGCAVLDSAGQLAFQGSDCDGAPASGTFAPPFSTKSGWGQLSISTRATYHDDLQMRAAGFLEGYLTAQQIHAHHHNVKAELALKSETPTDWLEEQDAWARQQVELRARAVPQQRQQQQEQQQHLGAQADGAEPQADDAAFWAAMRLLLAQLDGLQEGYEAARLEQKARLGAASSSSSSRAGQEGAQRQQQRQQQQQQQQQQEVGGAEEAGEAELPALGRREFLFIQAVGDLGDLGKALDSSKRVDWAGMQPHEIMTQLHSAGRCSALIKVTSDLSDLLLGHSAWFSFGMMVRIYKHYSFQLTHPAIALCNMTFSGYPGELSSDDDFYLLSTGLAVLQTTNSIFNTSLYQRLTPQSVLSWQRERVASFLAHSGREWAALVSTHNSGTGNNQWMAVDLNLFQPGQELPAGLLTVVETIPGQAVVSDQTEALLRGYWPSYNVPFHPEIYKASGYPEFLQQQAQRGEAYARAAVAGASYQLAPRAKIFRRDVGNVNDLASLQAFLRSNGWPNEPFSGGSPLGAICGRGDLDPQHPKAYGCYDTKVTRYSLALRREACGVVGPTQDGGRLAPFDWRDNTQLAAATPHIGQPQRFANTFELLTPDASAWPGSAEQRRPHHSGKAGKQQQQQQQQPPPVDAHEGEEAQLGQQHSAGAWASMLVWLSSSATGSERPSNPGSNGGASE